MRWLLMQLAPRAVTCLGCRLNISSLMSSPDLINIPAKQTPVINRLHDCMTQAMAYAHAIRDNAQDDGVPIPIGTRRQLFKRPMTTSSLHLQKPHAV
jgi:hypothetical protein